MKVGIVLFEKYHGRKNIGSSRIRGHWLAKYWDEAEIFVQGGKYDVVIYQKAYWVEHAKVFDGIKILDLCVSGDSLIFTDKGWVYSKDIKIGDNLLTHNGVFEKVNEVYKRKALTKNVKVSGLPNIRMTGNHPILSYHYKNDARKDRVYSDLGWRNVDDLKVTGKAKSQDYYKRGHCAVSLDKRSIDVNNLSDDEGWFWGYYSAEGSRNINSISFAMHKNEIEQRNKILEVINNVYNKKGRYYNILDNVGRVDFNSRKLSSFIKKNIHSSDKKNVPFDIFNASKQAKLNFLEGYIAGDGYCNDYGGISVSSISKQLAYSVWQLFNDCGIKASLNYHKREGDSCKFVHKNGKEYKGKPQWRVQLNPKESIKFCKLSKIEQFKKCKVFYWKSLKSKNTEIRKVDQYYVRPIRNIENFIKEDVYNFNVGESHSYIVGGLVTHNCDPDFLEWGYRTVEMLEHVDAVTTSTESLAEAFRNFTDKPVVCIPDRLDLQEHKDKKYHTGRAKWAVWFGYSSNFHLVKPVLHFLKKARLNLIIISNKGFSVPSAFTKGIEIRNLPWSAETVNQDIIEGDIVINPRSEKGRWKYKSNNKTLSAWALGMPVAHDIEELNKFLDPIVRREESVLRIKEIRERWDINLSVKELKSLIKQLYERRQNKK